MTRGLSSYLDFVRVGAALVVLLSHAWTAFVPGHPLPWPGHQAVVVFFVLSGFVIAFVSAEKETGIGSFALARAVRILSVTVPALGLSLCAAYFFSPNFAHDAALVGINFAFLGQSWSENAMLPPNAPYWSLCYEVWYYAIFAAAVFTRGWQNKVFWTTLACVIAGPKILLLMPCWLCGVALYAYRDRLRLSERTAAVLFLSTVVAYAAFFWFDVSIHMREALRPFAPTLTDELAGSNQFIGDFLLALIISANFVAVMNFSGVATRLLERWRKTASTCASVTLSLYLFHNPVIYILTHLGIRNPGVGLPLTIGIPVLLAFGTELRRKQIRDAIVAYWLSKPATAT